MIEEELKKSYKRLVEECLELNAFFKDKKNHCALAKKVNETSIIECPYLLEFKCFYQKIERTKTKENKV